MGKIKIKNDFKNLTNFEKMVISILMASSDSNFECTVNSILDDMAFFFNHYATHKALYLCVHNLHEKMILNLNRKIEKAGANLRTCKAERLYISINQNQNNPLLQSLINIKSELEAIKNDDKYQKLSEVYKYDRVFN